MRRLRGRLKRGEGLVRNAKRTYRLYHSEGLQVGAKKQRKLPMGRGNKAARTVPIIDLAEQYGRYTYPYNPK